jgi:hypothetical protein
LVGLDCVACGENEPILSNVTIFDVEINMKRETAHNEDERKINLVLINDFMINKDCQ